MPWARQAHPSTLKAPASVSGDRIGFLLGSSQCPPGIMPGITARSPTLLSACLFLLSQALEQLAPQCSECLQSQAVLPPSPLSIADGIDMPGSVNLPWADPTAWCKRPSSSPPNRKPSCMMSINSCTREVCNSFSPTSSATVILKKKSVRHQSPPGNYYSGATTPPLSVH